MTVSTLDHAVYTPSPAVTPIEPTVSQDEARAVDEEHLRAVTVGGVQPEPDRGAAARYADLLYRITGWEVFGDGAREYVSRLWAEDWDSPEDSAYDQI